jgi:epoxyqueuosine reductase
MSDVIDLTNRLKEESLRLGFDAVGIAPAVVPPGYPHYVDWLRQGFAAGMSYLDRQAAPRADPNHVFDGVRSIIVGAFVYGSASEPDNDDTRRGKVARYARGGDYHRLLWTRLEALLGWLRAECPEIRGRAVADTAPILERDFARLAGLGWIAKNTMLINRRLGSYTLFGALLVDAELAYDRPHTANHCGTCTRCLDACPTDAFVGPYQLDSRRCISYWTIEHRGPIPDEAARRLEGWAFGCDVCQEVCPWNRKAPAVREPELMAREEWLQPDLIEWLNADPAVFQQRLRGTALARAKRTGLLRNAALILGQRRVQAAIPGLVELLGDDDPTLRITAAWALGQIASAETRDALQRAENDSDPTVRDAIRRALEFADTPLQIDQ